MLPLLTVADVAQQFKLSPQKIYEIKDEIGYHKIGGSIRFAPDDVEQFLGKTKMRQERGATERSTRQLPRPYPRRLQS
jgi:excisionase family DNA binding protein